MAETKSQERLNDMARSGAFGSSDAIRRQAVVEPRPKNRIERTSAGLRDALFDAIEKVRDGDMSCEDAVAIAKTAQQICSTVQLEIQVAKLRTEYPADAKLIIPSPLQLGPSEQKNAEK